MFNFLKRILFTEVPKIEDENYTTEEKKLLDKLENLIQQDGLVELLSNEVVGIYLLLLWYPSLDDIVNGSSTTSSSTKYSIPVENYFDGRVENIYYFLKRLKSRVTNRTLNTKQKEDINSIIEMFDFYKEE